MHPVHPQHSTYTWHQGYILWRITMLVDGPGCDVGEIWVSSDLRLLRYRCFKFQPRGWKSHWRWKAVKNSVIRILCILMIGGHLMMLVSNSIFYPQKSPCILPFYVTQTKWLLEFLPGLGATTYLILMFWRFFVDLRLISDSRINKPVLNYLRELMSKTSSHVV